MYLNVFTDASVKHSKDRTYTVGCPGFTIFKGRQMILPVQSQYIPDSTNNESEIIAILNALYYILCNRIYFSDITEINIFSDSKISIYGLREWYNTWRKNIRDGIMLNSSGKPVANGRFFIEAIGIIDALNIKVNLYHCNGHINIFDKKSVDKFIKTFYKENRCVRELTKLERDFIIDGNTLVDNMTGVVDNCNVEYTKSLYGRRIRDQSMVDVHEMIKTIDFNHYRTLIGDYKNIHLF